MTRHRTKIHTRCTLQMTVLCVKMVHNTVLYNVHTILHRKNCVYLCIYDMYHILLPLGHTYESMDCKYIWTYMYVLVEKHWQSGLGSSVGIATDYGLDGPGSNPDGDEIFRTCPHWPWGPPSLLYNVYRVFPGGKVRPRCAADHSPPSSAAVMEQ